MTGEIETTALLPSGHISGALILYRLIALSGVRVSAGFSQRAGRAAARRRHRRDKERLEQKKDDLSIVEVWRVPRYDKIYGVANSLFFAVSSRGRRPWSISVWIMRVLWRGA